MVDDPEKIKRKKRKSDDDKENKDDDFPKEAIEEFINFLAENMRKIMPDLEKFFTQFQEKIGNENFDLEQFNDINKFKIPKENLPQIPRTATISKPYRSEDPLIDIMDNDDNITIIVELPGLEKNDIKINLKNKEVNVSVPKINVNKKISLNSV